MELISKEHGAVTYAHTEDGKTIVGRKVDVSQNLDRVQRLRHYAVPSETLGQCVASIPMAAIAQWGQQFGITVNDVINDDKLLDRCLADYNKFKVHKGWA